MRRRKALKIGSSLLVYTAGCTSLNGVDRPNQSSDRPSNPESPHIYLVNETDSELRIQLTVKGTHSSQIEYEEQVEVAAEEKLLVNPDLHEDRYEVEAYMVDGPVETVFAEEWDVTQAVKLIVKLRSSSISFETK